MIVSDGSEPQFNEHPLMVRPMDLRYIAEGIRDGQPYVIEKFHAVIMRAADEWEKLMKPCICGSFDIRSDCERHLDEFKRGEITRDRAEQVCKEISPSGTGYYDSDVDEMWSALCTVFDASHRETRVTEPQLQDIIRTYESALDELGPRSDSPRIAMIRALRYAGLEVAMK